MSRASASAQVFDARLVAGITSLRPRPCLRLRHEQRGARRASSAERRPRGRALSIRSSRSRIASRLLHLSTTAGLDPSRPRCAGFALNVRVSSRRAEPGRDRDPEQLAIEVRAGAIASGRRAQHLDERTSAPRPRRPRSPAAAPRPPAPGQLAVAAPRARRLLARAGRRHGAQRPRLAEERRERTRGAARRGTARSGRATAPSGRAPPRARGRRRRLRARSARQRRSASGTSRGVTTHRVAGSRRSEARAGCRRAARRASRRARGLRRAAPRSQAGSR